MSCTKLPCLTKTPNMCRLKAQEPPSSSLNKTLATSTNLANSQY